MAAIWVKIADFAQRQHGVVSAAQLLAAGLTRGGISAAAGAGRLHRVHRGVYAVGHRRLGRLGWWMAAVLSYSAGAALSHQSAAGLWGIARAARDIQISHRSNVRSRRGVRAHRSATLNATDVTTRSSIPVTTVSRTLIDLASVLDLHQLRSAWEEADRLGLLQLTELIEQCERNAGRAGTGHLRRWAEEATAPSPGKTELERLVLQVCEDHGLPRPETNVIVEGYEADTLWADSKVIVEADSFEFHRSRGAFERDRRRDVQHRLAGYTVVRLTHRRLTQEPEAVAEELRALLAAPPPVPTIR